jgi:hypothetical protein
MIPVLPPLGEGRIRLDVRSGDPCSHPATDFLGTNQGAVFYRCQCCGAILVRQEGRVWVFPPAPGARERD